ncbi:MAG: hypothetical protein JSR44_05200 [Spirochaetes bacterium]|nr:hypothetical protein [Spirochaetota bacterium]
MQRNTLRQTSRWLFLSIALSLTARLFAAEVSPTAQAENARIKLLIYSRSIVSAQGNFRIDENLVPNFWLSNWLRFEPGLRFGQSESGFGAYYHYKLELQTKSFWEVARVITRLSDDVEQHPTPSATKTNALSAIETKWRLNPKFMFLLAGGFVFTGTQNNRLSFAPSFAGTNEGFPIFKASFRYIPSQRGYVEATYGSYDVFNPYALNQPFFQVGGEYSLSKDFTFTGYFRYQYDNNVTVPKNYFVGLGIKTHL